MLEVDQCRLDREKSIFAMMMKNENIKAAIEGEMITDRSSPVWQTVGGKKAHVWLLVEVCVRLHCSQSSFLNRDGNVSNKPT